MREGQRESEKELVREGVRERDDGVRGRGERVCSVDIATNLWTRDPLAKTFKSTKRLQKLHIRWVPGGCFRGCKLAGA